MGKTDYVKNLVDYVKKLLKKGYTKESLKWALVNQGHSRLEVDKALAIVDQELAREAPILQTRPEIKVEIISEVKPEKKSFWKKMFG